MNYRQLTKDIQVSEIGMGCWGIGSDAYGASDDDESCLTLAAAITQDINFFDTADIYGSGHSEELVGEVLYGARDEFIIATKVGSLPHTGKTMPIALDPMHITISCNESLKRLRTSYIDLYQLHSPPVPLMEQALYTMELLKRDGKIRAIGVSVKSPDDGLEAVKSPFVDVIQVNFNMIDQRARTNGLLDKCLEAGIGVIARTPLAFGFLTGKYSKGAKFNPPDHRANWSQEQIDLWAEAPSKFYIPATTMNTQRALSYCLSHPAVSTVIPGMMTPLEVIENTMVHELYRGEIAHIEAVYNSNNFFIGGYDEMGV